MKMVSKTPDAPYSDTFVIREAWLAVTKSETDQRCILQKYMKVDFLKYTMFKSQITGRAEEGYFETEGTWKKHVEEVGLLKRQGSVAASESSIQPGVESRKEKAAEKDIDTQSTNLNSGSDPEPSAPAQVQTTKNEEN